MVKTKNFQSSLEFHCLFLNVLVILDVFRGAIENTVSINGEELLMGVIKIDVEIDQVKKYANENKNENERG